MVMYVRDKDTLEKITFVEYVYKTTPHKNGAYKKEDSAKEKDVPEENKIRARTARKINKNEVIIKKEGFLYAIAADYGLILKDTNDVYILFSNNLDAILDETKKQLPDNLYELITSGKGIISQRFSRPSGGIYKTDFLYKEFGKGTCELSTVDNYKNLFRIKSFNPKKI